MSNQELIMIRGGGWLTASFMNACARVVNTALELGRTLGSSIRYAISGRHC